MLAVSILWIVIGIVYVIYRSFKEKTKSTILFFKIMFPAIILLTIAVMLYSWGYKDIAKGIVPICFLVGFPIFIVWLYSGDNPEKISRKRMDSIDKWTVFMKEGYPKIRREDIELLVDHPKSPLNGEKTHVQRYELFQWISSYRTAEIFGLSDKRLGEVFGIPIEDIPLDTNLDMYSAKQTRRFLVASNILERYGLIYWEYNMNIHNRNVVINDDYANNFNNFIKQYNSEHH